MTIWKLVFVLSALSSCAMAQQALRKEEKEELKASIDLIAKDVDTHAMNIFIDLFTARPDFVALFKKVDQNTPIEQLREDPFLKRHSSKILVTIATVISELMDDPDALYMKFIDVAEHHIPRNVDHTNLAVLKDVVINYLRKTFTSTLQYYQLSNLLRAWTIIFKTAYNAFEAVNTNNCSPVLPSNRTFLTDRQQQLMKDNIALIATDLDTHAMNIFIDMFNDRPYYRRLFRKVKQYTAIEKLRDDPFLKKHSSKILLTIATVITDLMHDPDALYTKFIEVAEHHVPRDVDHTNLKVLKDVVLNYLKKALSAAMPPLDLRDLLCAWERILDKAYEAFLKVNRPTESKRPSHRSNLPSWVSQRKGHLWVFRVG